MTIETYKKDFIETALQATALKFGSFELKSKRISPYFFKADCFNSGELLRSAGNAYAQTIISKKIPGSIIFGPAYKGIPLAVTTVTSLATAGENANFSSNRKETKTHGDSGDFLGVRPNGKCIIIDDVITSGMSINESVVFIRNYGGEITGALVMVDRQERGLTSDLSAIQEIEQAHGFTVHSIITLNDIFAYTRENPDYHAYAPQIESYRAQYGIQ